LGFDLAIKLLRMANEDWTDFLKGKNAAHERFLPDRHIALNSTGQLIDRWGLRYFFTRSAATASKSAPPALTRSCGRMMTSTATPMAHSVSALILLHQLFSHQTPKRPVQPKDSLR